MSSSYCITEHHKQFSQLQARTWKITGFLSALASSVPDPNLPAKYTQEWLWENVEEYGLIKKVKKIKRPMTLSYRNAAPSPSDLYS